MALPLPADAAALRQPGAIVLASSYELGRQPLGLALPAAFLARRGFAAELVDLAAGDFDPRVFERARFVGLSVPMHTAARLGRELARRIRSLNPAAHICFYGLYALLNSDELLGGLADSVIGGEYEGPLSELVAALASGQAGPVPGVVVAGHAATPHLERLAFPAPERRGLPPLERYAQLEHLGELKLTGSIEASRGCLHRCRHCPIPPVYDGRFFVVPAEVVLEDVGRLVAAGARHLSFADPDFLNGPSHALRVARAIHARHPELSFDVTVKVEHILKQRRLWPELASLGCLFVVSAVESLSDAVLAILDKGHTRADALAAIAILRRAGITLRPTFVPFTPWSSMDDLVDLFDVIEDHGLAGAVDPIQYTIRLLLPPGSLLLERRELEPHLGALDSDKLSYAWRHPDPRMDRLQAELAALVAHAAAEAELPELTLERARALVELAVPRARPSRAAPVARAGVRPPRLTEAWFC